MYIIPLHILCANIRSHKMSTYIHTHTGNIVIMYHCMYLLIKVHLFISIKKIVLYIYTVCVYTYPRGVHMREVSELYLLASTFFCFRSSSYYRCGYDFLPLIFFGSGTNSVTSISFSSSDCSFGFASFTRGVNIG